MRKEEKRREEKKYGNNRDFGGEGGEGGEVARSPTQPPVNAQKIAKWVAVNEKGLAIGESHPRAVLSDHEVGLVLELREAGLSFGVIATKMEVSKSCIAKIVWGERRAQYAVGFRRARGPG